MSCCSLAKMGHSKTTWTNFGPILTQFQPPYPLWICTLSTLCHVTPSGLSTHAPLLIHVVIECPPVAKMTSKSSDVTFATAVVQNYYDFSLSNEQLYTLLNISTNIWWTKFMFERVRKHTFVKVWKPVEYSTYLCYEWFKLKNNQD